MLFDFRSWRSRLTEIYFCNWNTTLVHAFLLLGSFGFGSLDHLLSSFLGSQSSFRCNFVVFWDTHFFFPRATVGTQSTWNWSQSGAGSLKTFCYKLVHSLALFLFVALLQLTAEIYSFLLLVMSSSCSPCSPWSEINIIYKKTLSLYAFHFCSNSPQQRIKPSLLSHINSSLDTVCLRLRDTKMADSNRC